MFYPYLNITVHTITGTGVCLHLVNLHLYSLCNPQLWTWFATIPTSTKLQNIIGKLTRPTNPTFGRIFQRLKILHFRKLYLFSVSKLMHSYCNKFFPNYFIDYFIPNSSIHSHHTKLFTSKNPFLCRIKSSSGWYTQNYSLLKTRILPRIRSSSG